MPRAWIAAVLALVLVAPGATADKQSELEQKRWDEKRKIGTTATEEQTDGLPDYGDPAVSKRLRCSACRCLTKEVHSELRRVDKLRHGKPRPWEIEEVLEKICSRLRNDYGLLRRNNRPTEEFSKNTAISRLTGNWINAYIESRCGELMGNYEDEITDTYKEGELIDFQRRICGELDGSCTEAHLKKEMV
eukprot:TRINITY_DN44061_c0_g1_i1.p1 TRINITY_DN44061_c0_g1~~TRINITY_DN44061_c0_g1_i1.p1  ORF type:complete len:213 (+),score=77.80 TRINITY_DN44061_c0_g1_i1:71-640(+)